MASESSSARRAPRLLVGFTDMGIPELDVVLLGERAHRRAALLGRLGVGPVAQHHASHGFEGRGARCRDAVQADGAPAVAGGKRLPLAGLGLLELRMGEGGGAGAIEGSAGGSGATEPGGGLAGEAGVATSGLVDGCADLDTDGVADCDVTLVATPSFTSDVSGWTPLDDAELTWHAKNALGDLPSGSARLSAASPRASAAQCVDLAGQQLVIAYVQAFVESTPGAQDAPQALLEVSFFEADACGGERHRYFTTPPSTATGEWVTIQAGGLATEATRSLSIELVATQATSASDLSVYFDNVMLKAQLP